MTALIIEDELTSARKLERLLKNFDIYFLGNLTSIKETISWFQNNQQPELLFLDIQLADGLCFDIFESVNITSKIIFTTAFPKYSIKAFDFNGVSYLLKPINEKKLETAINKAKQLHQKDKNYEQLKKAFQEFETNIYKTSFAVKVGKKIKIIQVDDIQLFYSLDNATFLLSNSIAYSINQSLTSLENDLNLKHFFRVNRTFIINIKSIIDITVYSNSRLKVVLENYKEQEIIVSRERVKDFKNWID